MEHVPLLLGLVMADIHQVKYICRLECSSMYMLEVLAVQFMEDLMAVETGAVPGGKGGGGEKMYGIEHLFVVDFLSPGGAGGQKK